MKAIATVLSEIQIPQASSSSSSGGPRPILSFDIKSGRADSRYATMQDYASTDARARLLENGLITHPRDPHRRWAGKDLVNMRVLDPFNNWLTDNIHGYLKQIFDAFGPQRCFWGTDITRMPCSWKQCVTMFTEELPWLKGRDLELVMGRALCDWIGWDI